MIKIAGVLIAVLVMVALIAPYITRWDLIGEAFVPHAMLVPDGATGEFVPPEGGNLFKDADAHAYTTYVSSVGIDRAWPTHRTRLDFGEGVASNGSYVSNRVALIETRYRLPLQGMFYPRVVDWCIGSATFAEGAWTLAFTDPACAPANGRYTRWTTPIPPALRPTTPIVPWSGACAAYTDCVCALAAQNVEVFGRGCDDARALVARLDNDPAECAAGLTTMLSLATSLGLTAPARCSAR